MLMLRNLMDLCCERWIWSELSIGTIKTPIPIGWSDCSGVEYEHTHTKSMANNGEREREKKEIKSREKFLSPTYTLCSTTFASDASSMTMFRFSENNYISMRVCSITKCVFPILHRCIFSLAKISTYYEIIYFCFLLNWLITVRIIGMPSISFSLCLCVCVEPERMGEIFVWIDDVDSIPLVRSFIHRNALHKVKLNSA